MNELYKKVDAGESYPHCVRCPVCGSPAELWSYSKDFQRGPIDKVVMCTNGERFDPQDAMDDEGCLLYMPPLGFYKSRKIEAIDYWNNYAAALIKRRDEQEKQA